MSNWRPPCQLRHDDIQGVSANTGTSVTSGAGNTKGATTSLGSAAYDWDGFQLTCASAAGWDMILDLSIDSAASDLIVRNFYIPNSYNATAYFQCVTFPIPVKSGTTIYCRCQSSQSAQTCIASLVGYKSAWGFPPRFARAVGLGVTLSSTSITTIAANGLWNTYNQIVASTADHYGGFIVSPDSAKGSSGIQDMTITLAVGAAGAEQSLAVFRAGYLGRLTGPIGYCILCDVPSGARLSAKAQASSTSPNLCLSIQGLVV